MSIFSITDTFGDVIFASYTTAIFDFILKSNIKEKISFSKLGPAKEIPLTVIPSVDLEEISCLE